MITKDNALRAAMLAEADGWIEKLREFIKESPLARTPHGPAEALMKISVGAFDAWSGDGEEKLTIMLDGLTAPDIVSALGVLIEAQMESLDVACSRERRNIAAAGAFYAMRSALGEGGHIKAFDEFCRTDVGGISFEEAIGRAFEACAIVSLVALPGPAR